VGTICCDIDQRYLNEASDAAEAVCAFYPHVTATIVKGAAHLASGQESSDSLHMIWRTVLANELLLKRGADPRAGVIARLVA